MNIGIAVHHYDQAEGTGGYTVHLVERLARRHDVTLYARAVRTAVPDTVRVIPVRALGGPASATILTFPAAFERVRRPHDLVHAQGWVARRADVVTAHIVLGAWRAAAREAGVRVPWGERLFGGTVTRREAALIRGAGAVIAPSAAARDDIATHYDRTAGVHVVPHGFPPPTARGSAEEARRHLGLPVGPPLALYVGDARKGVMRAIAALSHTTEVHLAVVSHSNPHPYRQPAARLGVGDRLTWIGPLSDPAPAYTAADLLLYPTIYDTFGLVVAEAMAHGLPVIVSARAGIAEMVEHGRSGWVVGDPSAKAFADAVTALVGDADHRARMGAAAAAVARERTWDAVADATVAIYERVRSR